MKIKFLLLGWVTFISLDAHAACKPSDAKGTWVTYQSAFIAGTNGQHVGQCLLKVDAKGIVNQASSECEFVTFKTEKMPTAGTFKVNSDCSADINLELGSFVGQVQMNKDKNTYTGRFETQNGAVSGTTNAVKR